MPKRRRKFNRLDYWVLIACAVGAILFSSNRILQAWLLTRYQPTKGIVLQARVEEHEQGMRRHRFHPVVTYEYEVDETTYRNEVYSSLAEEDRGDENFANHIVAQFKPNSACTVYFNPARPEESVLNTRPRGDYWFILTLYILVAMWIIPWSRFQLQKLAREESFKADESAGKDSSA